ncbi:MAG: hypothetical protein EBS91_07105 [Betaproteobacteria bacterium]|nr:hypothetical protein [Microbacteriaceae bacterium]NCA24361.1 hypothetical protein [Betaproteobacteria bacterium]
MAIFRRERPAQPRSSALATLTGASSAVAAPYLAPRAMVAAAAQLRINDRGEAEQFRQRRNAMSSAWQAEAWEYYDAIGEIKYAFNLVASVISRIRLYVAVIDNPAQAPAPARGSSAIDKRLAAAAERALARLDSAYGGQAGMLRDAALNLSVAGECYLVQLPAKQGTGVPESWDIRSIDEVSIDNRGKYILVPRREMTGNDAVRRGAIPLANNAFVGRIWRAHPRFTDEADSSLRGLLDLCAELLLLNRTFRATARSRLNAGALYLPDGLSVAAAPDPNYPTNDSEYELENGYTPEEAQDEFEDQLIDAMTTPIRDEDSASAVVPLIIRGPAELGDRIKQFKFERSFDPSLAQRADRVLERILQGLDVPKDIVTGLANVKYSNALQIDESLYKAHIEPMMLLIADALTVVYLRPYLIANGFDPLEVDRVCIWYDPSLVATRNDRAADADSGFDRMAISYEAWRRAHGFAEADAPTAKEIALRMVMEKGAISPELTEGMIGAVAPDVMESIRQASQAHSVAPVPPELQQLLQGGQPAAAPAEGEVPLPENPSAPATTPPAGAEPVSPVLAQPLEQEPQEQQ